MTAYNLIITVIIFFTGCKKNINSEIYYLPHGFTGRVFIFYNQKSGEAEKLDSGAIVFYIPKNGVLKTKFNRDKNDSLTFFWLDSTGKKERIPIRGINGVDSNVVQIFNAKWETHSLITESNEMINGQKHTTTKTSDSGVYYLRFIVAKYSDRNKYNFESGFDEQSFIENIAKENNINW